MGAFRLPGPLGTYDDDELVCRPVRSGDIMVGLSGPGPLGIDTIDSRDFEHLREALREVEEQASQFAFRFIQDSKVRRNYLAEIRTYSNRIFSAVQRGEVSLHDGHLMASEMRNTILDALRLKSSDIGRAYAEGLKKEGLTLDELYAKYAEKLYKTGFEELKDAERNAVKLEIIKAAGRDRPLATLAARRLGNLGKGLWVLTLGIAVFNVATAKDKKKAAAYEGATLGANIAGGVVAGAAAGLVCGPGAVVCSSVLVIAGGALGALGMGYVFDWVWQ